tara:strand:- start:6750 stop:7559 length:810 start_codon:yes stop_codon:yes gene_type:complete
MSWTDDLPEELREAPYLAKAESAEDALGKLVHAAKLQGTSIRIPGEDASDDDRAAFAAKLSEVDGVTRLPTHDDIEGVMELVTKLGYPQEHTGYTLPDIEDFEWPEAVGENMRKYAHTAGMTPGQFEAFAKEWAATEQTNNMTSNQTTADMKAAVKTEWGDTYKDREALIRGWLDTSAAPQSLRDSLDSQDLPLDTMNWLLATANQFKGDIAPISDDGARGGAEIMTPADAMAQIPVVIQDLVALKKTDPRYRPLQEKLLNLQGFANPG